MDRTELLNSWYRICTEYDFMSQDVARDYSEALKRAGESDMIDHGLREFVRGACPHCGARGFFKLSPMGDFHHPGCGRWLNPAARARGNRAAKAAKPSKPPKPAAATVITEPPAAAGVEPPQQPQAVVCDNCKALVPLTRSFCPECGARRRV